MKVLTAAILIAALPTLSASAQSADTFGAANLAELGGGFTLHSRDLAVQHDHEWSAGRPDSHAPVGVMAEHVHNAGEWMLSVRWMRMHMGGMRDNTDSLSTAEVLGQGYAVTPTEMDMDMLMLGGMYAVSNDWTWMWMIPYLSNSMDHRVGLGGKFTTESEGLGDVSITAMRGLVDAGSNRVHLNLGVSLPTGSTDERDDTPAMANAKLPYPMQLGTGTVDLLPGVTYLGQSGDLSWGAQGTLRFHIGENDEGYKHGNRQNVTGWVSQRLGDVSTSLRLDFSHWENFHGADDDLDPAMVPTADPDLRGGDRLDALIGINYEPAGGGHRFALEAGVPLYQDLDGPALETDWLATIGWQYSW